MKSLTEVWNSYSFRGKATIGIIALILIGLSTRSWLFTIIAWGVILFYVAKVLLDLEML
ncbi:MAG: hypothetical protein HGA85_02925 [Nanoarchaeota archaeon]|nr:hypothetical protein [Nanoarchaeota archaeon]